MIIDTENLTNKFKALEDILVEYVSLTNMLLSANLEEITETDLIFSRRSETINRIEALRSEITKLIDAETDENAAVIRKMLSGQASVSNVPLSSKEKLMQRTIIDIRSLQIDILKKDEEIALKYKLKREEIRSVLADLQQDKKRINFYSNTASNTKGQTYDSQN